jgi:hypothetical protein
MKTSELTGKALNWAVGKAEGLDDWLAPVNYCGQWEHGGPIIQRENIGLWSEGYDWEAKISVGFGKCLDEWDESPLIAAMRCYVASKLGDEVNVPEELA